jgi:hypothetical protein
MAIAVFSEVKIDTDKYMPSDKATKRLSFIELILHIIGLFTINWPLFLAIICWRFVYNYLDKKKDMHLGYLALALLGTSITYSVLIYKLFLCK